MKNDDIKQELVGSYIKRQQLFIRFTFAVLVDLTVLNLFAQYWKNVYVASFTISLFTALLLQSLLLVTILIEHRVAGNFKAKPGVTAKVLRILSAWSILFISKLLILEAINYFFGSDVVFSGAVHGLLPFILVVISMIAAEQTVKKYTALWANAARALKSSKYFDAVYKQVRQKQSWFALPIMQP